MKPDPPVTRTAAGILLIICLLSLAGTAGAERVVAPSGAEFVSIQDAIDWSSAGETITVKSGYYIENVRITKRVTLVGVDSGGGHRSSTRTTRTRPLSSSRTDAR